MASRRIKLLASASAVVLGVGGYFVYSVFAVQGRGTLAQAPLNVQMQVPPAFIMALDDSGSLNWETLNNTRDGVFTWRGSSFFNSSNVAWGYGNSPNGDANRYLMLFPYPSRNNNQNSIPPVDIFGFARSPEFNPAYFDPTTVYEPWKNEDGSTFQVIDPENAPVDARASTPPAGSATGGYNKINTVFDLTSNVGETGNGWRFRVHDDMVLPAGLRYWRPNNCGNIPGPGGNWNTLSNDLVVDNIGGNSCQLGISYFPATFYLTTDSVPGYTATPVAVVNAQGVPAGTTLYKYEIRPGNYAAGAYAPAIQNFANYFTYYRTRRDALTSAMTNALVDVRNMRIGWFWINDRRNVTMRDMQVVADRTQVFDDVRRLRASGGTPSRQAARYLGEQFKRTGTNAPVALSCQKNAGMFLTDGYINDDNSPNVGGNLDGALGEPFADAFDNTMADIVVPYYFDSLVPGLEQNAVRVPDACAAVPAPPLLPPAGLRYLDCQTNLHMNFYGITLGTLGNQFGVTYTPDPNDPIRLIPDPYTNPPVWESRGDVAPKAVDEMWHATLNARGEMINATTPAAVTAAMRRVLGAASEGSSPAGSIALTGARIGAGSLTVVPFYEARNQGTDWYSTLTAQTVSTDPITRVVSFTNEWEAGALLPTTAGNRNDVWYGNGAGAQEFTATNIVSLDNLCNNPRPGMSLCSPMGAGAIDALGGAGTPITIDQAIDYLKGDQSLEVGRSPAGRLRFRTNPLGDIVNSTPVISSPRDDYGYRSLPAPFGPSYNTYLTTGKSNRRPMVYAGANDGMLHAFDGRLAASGGGVERFAYIPQGVLGHMGNLLFPYDPTDKADQKFDHRYFVDGPIAVSDAFYGGGWETVMVGTTGAGARGAFALNVSDVSEASGSFGASDRLWDISDLNMSLSPTVRQNIGYVLGRPIIVPVKTGTSTGPVRWRAIFGNGYNSVSGRAVLFLVDIGAGTPNITMIEATESGTGVPAGTNGLGNIVVTDRWGPALNGTLTAGSRDGFADTVYAADQKGAIWKFDLRDAAPANQTIPLFTTMRYTTGPEANTRQPILGGLTATAGPGGGVLIYFGTGSFSFDGDGQDTTRQSLYAVLDNNSGTTLTRTSLLQQTVGVEADGVRGTSSNLPLGLFSGWYLDLPTGERFVGYPRIESGLIFMPTYAPNAVTAGCGTSGNNWLYGLNSLTGAAGLSNVKTGSPTGDSPGAGTGAMALNTGGTAPVKDVAILTSPRVTPLDGAATPADLAAALGAQCSMIVQVAGAPPLYLPRACGRQSWRQIL